MICKLLIAGIKWKCNILDAIFNKSILRFESDFIGGQDISLKVINNDNIGIPSGKSITNDILEWYIVNEGFYRYQLLKRDEVNSEILVSLKANEDWSDILLEVNFFDDFTVEFINIVLLEVVFRNRLIFHNGLVIHSSCIEFEGEAITFAAPSGTGKSTHARIWQETYDVKVINDDHPAVRIMDGKPVIFGTPWAGENQLFYNKSSALKGIVILEQGPFNKIWRLDHKDIIRELVPRCFLPYYCNDLVQRAARIFNNMIDEAIVYKLICKPEPEAVMLVKEMIWPGDINKGMVSYE